MAKRRLPYGTWPSPVKPETLVERAVGLTQVEVAGGRVFWSEARPSEAGRQAVVGDGGQELLPAGFSARTQVHEYGGRCWCLHGGALVFSNWADQRLWLLPAGGEPTPLTAEPPSPRSHRYADPAVTPDGRWVLSVRERHGEAVLNDLVAIPSDGSGETRVLASGRDFYGAPRISPDGRRLAWVCWDHPDMPWDHAELWVADLGAGGELAGERRVAGTSGESVTQPRWSPDGVLHWVSDRSGWWNLYNEQGASLYPAEAEVGEPDWVFGSSTYAFLPDGRVVAAWASGGSWHLGLVSGGRAEKLELPFTLFRSLQPLGDGVACVVASPSEPPAVVRIGLPGCHVDVLRRSFETSLDPGFVSSPRHVEVATGGGEVAHVHYYAPTHPECEGPEGAKPPVLVTCHGGPTSAAQPVLNLTVQFWTSRGIAVADVDYRGSTGYGRAYRRRLFGGWGVLDVEDCAAAVATLGAEGLVDPGRAAIRGASAGGFTALAALASTEVFAAGASHYGVADLELLARETHKFESRYLDRLVGPYPEAAEEYRRRSPINHVDRISSPVVLLQGLDDTVVPPAQSELIYESLRRRGVPVAYLAFEGEQHGFRRAATIRRVAEAELAFFAAVLGFSPADDLPPLEIANY